MFEPSDHGGANRWSPRGDSRMRGSAPPYEQSAGDVLGWTANPLHYLRIVYKRRWAVLTPLLLIVMAVAVYTFTVTPVYESRVQLLIESDTPNVVEFQEVLDQELTAADYYQTQYKIIASRTLAKKTVDALGLWNHREFTSPDDRFDLRRITTRALSSIVDSRSADSDAFDRGAGAESLAQSKVIDAFLKQLTVAPIRNSRLVDVRFRSQSPALTARVANRLASAYIAQNLEFTLRSNQDASDWLGERLEEQRRKVEQSEAELQRYREANDAVGLEDPENIVVQKLADLNATVTRARTERLQREAEFNELQRIQEDLEALDSFPAILENRFVQQLKSDFAKLTRERVELSGKFGERHPEMIRVEAGLEETQTRLRREIAKVVAGVRSDYFAALGHERSLTQELTYQKTEALAQNRRSIPFEVLRRQVESDRKIFESLLQRTQETGISEKLQTNNIRVVDAGEVPRYPVSPRRGLSLLFAVLGGSMFGIALAFGVERLDSRIKAPDEVESYLGLPSLGLLPMSVGHHGPVLGNDAPAQFAEAVRAVRGNVVFSAPQDDMRSILVTSTGPGEGKTLVASNLAVSLAQSGGRVLLIDADMRRPRVHSIFDRPREPGLSDWVMGRARAKEVMRGSDLPNLWILPAGAIPPNPSELLNSERFRGLLESLERHFDWVLIDSPPVMAVADAAVVSNAVSGVLFVVGAEMIDRRTAQTALKQLDGAQARFVGAVLNKVRVDRHSYYYSPYYRQEYANHYQRTTG